MADKVRKGVLLDRVKDAPQLKPWLELYWAAYAELSTCRPPAFSGTPSIPWTAIHQYAMAWHFDFDQFCDLVYHVRRMDAAIGEQTEKG